ncbi:MAG: hypothetical protein A3D96_05325 [Chlamydiae bacterium RIFCSPHIGHO2_12_FULL_44_59]|nr:MAG: hypothetical protein A2796_03015 [Chlamydiae bacterium RIFCSPHIGHO2_01_FULL_44_39]OGN57687.1 MAG: hypothetical protein A3C42_06720 [Chlamydiae bacterium RIFCSPHIGHO2_02_FULL_45_9]OGN60235.1 MAG: hypothetical protein A3D96_05325 [Chlamydiae bacterium RIFCSPHIGHO2_12_FULL_44_59]OGN67112.1 MAG: hypothetical protein A2978_00720 [Chlamydiae bacterium RIFCSPLOWO2_01_FULL_44_52]OGN67702.1 MAG: hypothetical protein A3I67_04655 [Chlamydiae bacterium RIFCSPLOWO2_02_FULL_45_22]OGN71405.1 MAG: hyp
MRFQPIYQTYIWGGDRIRKQFHRPIQEPKVAESWEISDREDGMSVCLNGPFKGKTLHTLVLEMKEDLLGLEQKMERFPILTKIIDAKENLSIQVHPDSLSASKLHGEPKAEMYVALEDSTFYAGLDKGVDEQRFRKAIQAGNAETLLSKLDLTKGEFAFLPGGMIHAILKGSFVYEIQQNSDTTYRLYDWGRGRELHLEKGLEAIRWDYPPAAKIEPRNLSSDLHHQFVLLTACEFFVVERFDIFKALHIAPIPKSFQIYYCLEGEAQIGVDGHEERIEPGMTYLIPAACKTIDFNGKCRVIRIRLPCVA